MQMSGLPRIGIRPFGHEGHHLAVALRPDLGEGLEEHRTVGRRERIGILDRRLQNARPGFGVKPLERHIHLVAELEQRPIEFRLDRRCAASNSRTSRASDSSGCGSLFPGRCAAFRRTRRIRTQPQPSRQSPSPRHDPRHGEAAGAGIARAAVPSNSPRKNSMLPSIGTSRQVAGSMRAVASGNAVCQPVNVDLS